MDIKRMKKALTRHLGDDFLVVTEPDHPYLLTTPDILIGGKSNLVGVFFQKKAEIKNPDSLLVRLALSKLAFPSHFRSVLVLDPKLFDKNILGQIRANFNEVFPANDYLQMKSFVEDPRAIGPVEAISSETKEKTFQRYALLYDKTYEDISRNGYHSDPTETLEELTSRFQLKPAYTKSWFKQDHLKQSKQLFEENRKVIGAKRFEGSKSTSEQLRSLFNFGLMASYTLDNGIPYLRTNSTTNFLLVDEYPKYRYDPLKYLRAAAFSGWNLIKSRSTSETANYMDFLQKRVEEVRN